MKILFLADKFADVCRSETARYVGGAERTDKVAIDHAPYPITLSTWENVPTLTEFDWILVGNSQTASERDLGRLRASKRHVFFEHDLRICHWRGNFPSSWDPIHRWQHRCICPHPQLAKTFDTAAGTIFLSHLQKRHFSENPFWNSDRRHAVLGSSLFGNEFLSWVSERTEQARSGTALLSTATRSKGSKQARAMCKKNSWSMNPIENMEPKQVWETLAASERFVCLPIGWESAGRMPVEARLLGCKVVTNARVGVTGEPIWDLEGEDFHNAIQRQAKRFWELVESFFDY